MSQRALSILFVSLIASAPAVALAQTRLTSPGGQTFQFGNDGNLQNTSGMSLWTTGLQLSVNGAPYNGMGAPVTSSDGRTLTFGATSMGGLTVQRIVYVPATGSHEYVRWVNVLANSTATAVSANVVVNTTISGFGTSAVTGSSSGDMIASSADDWFTMNPGSSPWGGSTNPLVGAVIQGEGASVRAAAAAAGIGGGPFGAEGMSWSYSTTVPPFSRVSFVNFLVQQDTSHMDALTADATYLAAGPDEAMAGLDAYLDSIVNFPGDTAGAPRIRFAGPTLAMEGDALTVAVTVTDDGVATPTWTWDTNGDGTFGDLPGSAEYMVPAGTAPGGVLLRIGVEATNGVGTSQRYRIIEVTNVAPTVPPPGPPTETASDATYSYQIMAVDPGGAMDTLTYDCRTCPGTMAVSGTGLVTWTPTDRDVSRPGMPYHVLIRITDSGGATFDLAWDLTVLADHPPTAPMTVYPTGITIADLMPRIVAGNATDPDGDPLTYVFELDTVATFDSPGLIVSPPVPQTDGFTAYVPTTPLTMGTQYFWRVHANDGSADGPSAMSSFYTSGAPPAPDMGMVTPPDGGTSMDAGTTHDAGTTPPEHGGCSAAPGAPSGAATAVLAALAALVVTRRRRR